MPRLRNCRRDVCKWSARGISDVLIVGILLMSSSAKAAELASQNDAWLSTATTIAGIVIESLLIVAWIWSRSQRWVKLFALAVFGCFAVVSSHKWLVGASSCGCFGRIAIPPYVTFAIDIAIVAAIIERARCDRSERRSELGRIYVAVTNGAIAAALAIGLAMVSAGASQAFDHGGNGAVIISRPSTWQSKKAPILGGLDEDVARTLETGKWNVLIVNDECSHCNALLTVLESHLSAGMEFQSQTAIVVLGRHRLHDRADLLANKALVTNWWRAPPNVPTPCLLLLANGICISSIVVDSDTQRMCVAHMFDVDLEVLKSL